MRIEGVRYIRGTNAYARQPLVAARISLDGPPAPLDEAVWQRLGAALAAAGALPAGDRLSVADGGRSAIALAQATVDTLLRAVGAPDSGTIRRRGDTLARIGAVIAPLSQTTLARLSVQAGVGIARAALTAEGDLARRIDDALGAMRIAWDGWDLDVEHREVTTTCERLGVPWKRLSYMQGVLQLGEGAGQTKLVGLMTDATTNFAARLVQDKAATNLRLLQHGFPVARAQIVDSAAEAHAARRRFGLPMVLKPRGGKWNRGVTIVYGDDQIDGGFAAAAEQQSGVVAESYIPGREYRMLVAGGVLCGAHERIAPTVVGDGVATVAALIARANADPKQLSPAGAWGAPIELTELTGPYLRHQGHALDSVPAAGTVVGINPLPFRKYGATYRDTSDIVHPANLQLAIEVAALVDLDVAGIDIRLVDIARPWTDGPAGICEVNAGPGLDNIAVTGRARGVDVSGRLIERIVAPAGRRPMPFVLLAGIDDGPAAAIAIAGRIEAALGWRVGIALPGRVRMGGREVPLPDGQGPFAAVEVLLEAPTIDAAIVAFPVAALIDHGLARDRYDVAVVAPASADPRRVAILAALLDEGRTEMVAPGSMPELADRLVEALRKIGVAL